MTSGAASIDIGDRRGRKLTTAWFLWFWEVFGNAGIGVLLLLYLVQGLHLKEDYSTLLVGAFGATSLALSVFGGWLGDKAIGSRRAVTLSPLVLVVGYTGFAIVQGLFAATFFLAVVAVGRGLFTTNIANLVRSIYRDDASRLDGAFTICFITADVASLVAGFLAPYVRDHYGWHAAFAISIVVIAVGFANIVLARRLLATVGSEPDLRPIDPRRVAAVGAGLAAFVLLIWPVLLYPDLAKAFILAEIVGIAGAWAWLHRRASTDERRTMTVLYVLAVQVMTFFVLAGQVEKSLTLFAVRGVDLDMALLGTTIFRWSPAQFQSLVSLWILVFTPLVTVAYFRLGGRDGNIHIVGKYTIAFVALALAFACWWLAAARSGGVPISAWVFVAGTAFIGFAQVFVAGASLATIARYAPAGWSAFMTGGFFVLIGVASLLGSIVANLGLPTGEAVADVPRLMASYGWLFGRLSLVSVGCAIASAGLLLVVGRIERARRAAA